VRPFSGRSLRRSRMSRPAGRELRASAKQRLRPTGSTGAQFIENLLAFAETPPRSDSKNALLKLRIKRRAQRLRPERMCEKRSLSCSFSSRKRDARNFDRAFGFWYFLTGKKYIAGEGLGPPGSENRNYNRRELYAIMNLCRRIGSQPAECREQK